MNNETHRPSPRSRRTGRGPEDRRRRAGTSGSARQVRGTDGFVDGQHGTDPRERPPRRPGSEQPARSGKLAAWWTVWGPHVRRFGPGVLLNHGVTLAVILVVSVILAIGTTFRAVPAYIGSMWLLSNLSPVTISGADLGVAPLLPALLILYFHARRLRTACGTTITVRGIRALAVLGVLVPAVLTVIAWLMLWDASKVFDVDPPNILHALVTTVLLNGTVVIAGLGPKIWRALLLRRGMPTWPVESVLLAGRFLGVMMLVGAAAVGVGLLVNHAAVGRAFDIAGGFGGVLGLFLLSVLYFPNLAVGATSVLMGGEMHIGEGSASLFAVTNTTLPPLPVLAVMPNDEIPLGPVLLVVPAVLAVLTVYRWFAGRRYIESPLFTAAGAGVVAGVAGLLLAWVAGGQLGYYGSTGPLLWLTPLLFLVWLVLPSLIVFGWVARSGNRVTESDGATGAGDWDGGDLEDGVGETYDDEAEVDDGDAGRDAGEDAADGTAQDADTGVGSGDGDAASADAEDSDEADAEVASDEEDAEGVGDAEGTAESADAADTEDADDTGDTDDTDGDAGKDDAPDASGTGTDTGADTDNAADDATDDEADDDTAEAETDTDGSTGPADGPRRPGTPRPGD